MATRDDTGGRARRVYRRIVAAGWHRQTRAELNGYRNALNLFFGALLGANLGTVTGLAVREYVSIVAETVQFLGGKPKDSEDQGEEAEPVAAATEA